MTFSVIVPIYNVEAYLYQCIDSILAQTYKDFELILVDDGSTDNSSQIIDDYALQDSRVTVIHKENGGSGSARKAGANVACGEYVVIVDGDDWIAKNTLSKIFDAVNTYGSDVICYGYFRAIESVYQEVPLVNKMLQYTKKDIETMVLPNLIIRSKDGLITPTLWGKAFRRSIYTEYQNRVENWIRIGEDAVVVYPCICQVDTICFLPERLYYYRLNPNSLTQSKSKLIPWNEVLWRIEYLRQSLPMDKHNMQRQMGCYIAHVFFNSIQTQLAHKDYKEIKKEAVEILRSNDYIPLIRNARLIGSFPEKLAQIAIANKWFFAIKLYSMIK